MSDRWPRRLTTPPSSMSRASLPTPTPTRLTTCCSTPVTTPWSFQASVLMNSKMFRILHTKYIQFMRTYQIPNTIWIPSTTIWSLLFNIIWDNNVPGRAYDCLHHSICRDGQSIMFAWAKNAPPTTLPSGVSFTLDPGVKRYLVLQVHYAHQVTFSTPLVNL